MSWRGVIEEYREYLPVSDKTPVVTLLEGNTPLIEARGLSERTGLRVYLKFEGGNPTGSFKDRGMTMAVSKAAEEGASVVICASTGNTSASAAAYAARAGMECVVVIPDGNIALGKLSQAMIYGAKVIAIRGNFDEALSIVRKVAVEHPEIALVNSVNPYRLQGQKTGAFEVYDQLGRVPDYFCLPVGNAGNITAYWMGFTELDGRKATGRPVMCGFQAEGAAPLVHGKPVDKPETVATAIRIGNPASWSGAVKARDESGGIIEAVSDAEILEAYRVIAGEGIFCEPASAASVAGLLKMSSRGYFEAGKTAVCVLTGHGLKDPDNAVRSGKKPETVDADLDAVRDVILKRG